MERDDPHPDLASAEFAAEVVFQFVEEYHRVADEHIDRLVYGDRSSPGPQGILGGWTAPAD